MKKIALLAALLLMVTNGSALAAYAAGDDAGSLELGTTAQVTVKLSKGVELDYIEETDGLGYIVGAYHTSGTKTFASSSGDSKIWSMDGTAEALPTTAPAGTESADFSDWTPL